MSSAAALKSFRCEAKFWPEFWKELSNDYGIQEINKTIIPPSLVGYQVIIIVEYLCLERLCLYYRGFSVAEMLRSRLLLTPKQRVVS